MLQLKAWNSRRGRLIRRVVAYLTVVSVAYLIVPHSEDVSHKVFGKNMYPSVKEEHKSVDLNKILMTASELKKVLSYLKQDVRTYLEWGSGGSTLNFPQYVSERVVSIEHDKEWCEKMQHDVKGTAKVDIEVHCVPVPRGTMGWGSKSPFEEGDYRVFRKYIDEIDNLKPTTWDFILIDGRARVDAAIKSLSHVRNDSIVVLHDSWRMRWKYSEVYDYYDVIDETIGAWNQGVAIMKRKPSYAYLQGRKDLTQAILSRKYNL